MSRQMLEHGFVRRLNLDPARTFSILNVTRFVVMGLAVVIGLSVIGINLSSLAVLFGVLGIGLGFGLQQAVGDMFAGLIIIFSPKITGNPMHNYSYDDVSVLMCNTVQVSYGSDLDFVGEVLIGVAARNPWRLGEEPGRYRVWSFDDSGITVRLCTWIRDTNERVEAYSWTNLEIWRAFRDNGIEIPFPQMDLHVRSGLPPGRDKVPTVTEPSPTTEPSPETE